MANSRQDGAYRAEALVTVPERNGTLTLHVRLTHAHDLGLGLPDGEYWNAELKLGVDPGEAYLLAEAITKALETYVPRRVPEPPCPGDSPIEKDFAAAWRSATGAYPEAQVQIGPYRADFRIGKVIVECDGHAYHSSKDQRGRDAERDIYLQRQGYRVARFTGTQIAHNAAACVAQVRSLL
jgi:hypothetical protein